MTGMGMRMKRAQRLSKHDLSPGQQKTVNHINKKAKVATGDQHGHNNNKEEGDGTCTNNKRNNNPVTGRKNTTNNQAIKGYHEDKSYNNKNTNKRDHSRMSHNNKRNTKKKNHSITTANDNDLDRFAGSSEEEEEKDISEVEEQEIVDDMIDVSSSRTTVTGENQDNGDDKDNDEARTTKSSKILIGTNPNGRVMVPSPSGIRSTTSTLPTTSNKSISSRQNDEHVDDKDEQVQDASNNQEESDSVNGVESDDNIEEDDNDEESNNRSSVKNIQLDDNKDDDDDSFLEEERARGPMGMAGAMARILGQKTAPQSNKKTHIHNNNNNNNITNADKGSNTTTANPKILLSKVTKPKQDNTMVVLSKTKTPLQRLAEEEKIKERALQEKRKLNRERRLVALHEPLSVATTAFIAMSSSDDNQNPISKELEEERTLRRIATRGVVALFNAITQHQHSSTATTASSSGPSNVATSPKSSDATAAPTSENNTKTGKMNKHVFLDRIKQAAAAQQQKQQQKEQSSIQMGNKGNPSEPEHQQRSISNKSNAKHNRTKTNDTTTTTTTSTRQPQWKALQDDFMLDGNIPDPSMDNDNMSDEE